MKKIYFFLSILFIVSCSTPSGASPTAVPTAVATPTITSTRTAQPPIVATTPALTPTQRASTPALTAMTTCHENPPPNSHAYLENPSFEETVADSDNTLDPQNWEVTEGKTIQGTGDVIEEMPGLVQVVGPEGNLLPCDGNQMLKIDARLTLKSAVRQYYPQPISEDRLIQELAVCPSQGEYVQQIEIRGKPDFKEVEGKEIFHLRWTDEGLLLRVRTGSPDFEGQSGFYKIFQPLPADRWSFIRLALEKTQPTQDSEGRTISQWKLTVEVNEDTLFDSDREQVYAQYIQSAEFVFIGDETMSGKTHKLKPSNTGDGIGIVYYDAVRAWRQKDPRTGINFDDAAQPVARRYQLVQNYPNPFNLSTIIRFLLPQRVHVMLKVFDVNGREVARLVDGEMVAGKHDVTFAPRDLAGGIYFYQITAGKFSQTRKAVMMK